MLKIGDFSKLSRISIRMLRHYDEIGLLVPRMIDDSTAYRYYDESQLPIASRIASLRDMGFSLSTISELLENYDDPQLLAEYLTVKYAEVLSDTQEANRRLLLLDSAIKGLRKGLIMQYNVTVKTFPERTVASVRKVIPAYNQEGTLWEILMNETIPLNIRFAENCNSLAMFHDDGFKETDIDVEVQMTVKGQYENTANVVFKTEPAVEIASAVYEGSYDQITTVNHAVASWIKDNGYEFAGQFFCIYHVSPNETQNPDEFVTEVCYSIKKK